MASGVYEMDSVYNVEVVNLDPSRHDLVCDPVPDFPIGLYAGTGQLVNVILLFLFAFNLFFIQLKERDVASLYYRIALLGSPCLS